MGSETTETYSEKQRFALKQLRDQAGGGHAHKIPANLMPYELAHQLKVSQAELARLLDVSAPYLYTVQIGGIKRPMAYVDALKKANLWPDE